MNEFFVRQFGIVQEKISEYRRSNIDLNKLVWTLEGVLNVCDDSLFQERAFPVLLELEQINATCFESEQPLTNKEFSDVEGLLVRLETLMMDFEKNAVR